MSVAIRTFVGIVLASPKRHSTSDPQACLRYRRPFEGLPSLHASFCPPALEHVPIQRSGSSHYGVTRDSTRISASSAACLSLYSAAGRAAQIVRTSSTASPRLRAEVANCSVASSPPRDWPSQTITASAFSGGTGIA